MSMVAGQSLRKMGLAVRRLWQLGALKRDPMLRQSKFTLWRTAVGDMVRHQIIQAIYKPNLNT